MLGSELPSQDVASDLLAVEVDAELAEKLRRFPLPAGVLDADMNQEEIAQALNTTVNTISKWIRDGMPVAQVGGNGRAYVLRLSHCWAWRNAREADLASRTRHNEAQISLLRAEFLGVDIDNPAATLSAKERRELAEADMRWSEAQRRRGQLVPLSDVVDLLESIGKIVRDGIESMPDRMERELDLSPAGVATVGRIGADILTAISDRIEEEELQGRDLADIDPGARLMI
ncbi:terminase small subunit [Paracoccus sp. MBLB3053]|uniref:Terminase small subunit n=1 Tax=Paracoccus aurantius TaxID=3073814 RepID=A0ABU2HT19_9RHOB|nr:terminase small subunit [Paracoccus sp. MBLB3053]MDS9468202.1 terminase small subunit [Paracoccus sp. MBLB3053]